MTPADTSVQENNPIFDPAYVRRLTCGFGALFLTAIVLLGLGSVAQAETLGVHADWTAFKTAENGKAVCYIGSEPTRSEGDYTSRGETYVLVTHRPADGQNDVVSVRAGYAYRSGSEVAMQIGSTSVNLFTQDDHAWAYDTAGDQALVAAMKRGATMIVRGTSSRGTLTTDTYSLTGFTAAYNSSRQACGL